MKYLVVMLLALSSCFAQNCSAIKGYLHVEVLFVSIVLVGLCLVAFGWWYLLTRDYSFYLVPVLFLLLILGYLLFGYGLSSLTDDIPEGCRINSCRLIDSPVPRRYAACNVCDV